MTSIDARAWAGVLIILIGAGLAGAQEPAATPPADRPPRQDLRWMLTGPMGAAVPDEQWLTFVERVRPDVVVIGAFSHPQWAAQGDPRQWLADWSAVFERLHRANVKVVGTFELLTVGDSPEQEAKWCEFVDQRWNEALLGPRPAGAAKDMLEQRPTELADLGGWSRGCASDASFRVVQAALMRAIVKAGIDGLVTHRNMYGLCACPDCVAGFRAWLTSRYTPPELSAKFGIEKLDAFEFAAIVGQHRDHKIAPPPLRLEAMKFTRHLVKENFDELFLEHGRAAKPDLIVAQWNHMPIFDELHSDKSHLPPSKLTSLAHVSADERWSLPIETWGRGEDFFWYSNWGTTQNTQLEKQFVGDVTLYAKLHRSLVRGRPYILNKYDFYRPRNMLAEAAALGMMAGGMELYCNTPDEIDMAVRYFEFFRRHAQVYRDSNGASVSDVLLVFPRSATHEGQVDLIETVEAVGRNLVVDHTQFDFVPDDMLGDVDLTRYRVVITPVKLSLDAGAVERFVKAGGRFVLTPPIGTRDAKTWGFPKETLIVDNIEPHWGGKAKTLRLAIMTALAGREAAFHAPYTVEPHVYHQPGKLVVHFVNYNHTENAPGKSVAEREAPIAAAAVAVRLPFPGTLGLPAGTRIKAVRFFDPDGDEREISFNQHGDSVTFQTPSFLVYGLCVVEYDPTVK